MLTPPPLAPQLPLPVNQRHLQIVESARSDEIINEHQKAA